MIYDSLDIIPYKLFYKIASSGDFLLLSDELEKDADLLSSIWDKIYDEHLYKNKTSESERIFKLSKNIDELLAMNKVVVMACSSLKFEFNQDMYDIVQSYGFKISTEDTDSYHGSLDKILREAKSFVIKAQYYQKMLPEKKEGQNTEYNPDDVMASYSAILGYSIGKHNEVTYNEYYAHEKSVNAKIDSQKAQINKQNGKS